MRRFAGSIAFALFTLGGLWAFAQPEEAKMTLTQKGILKVAEAMHKGEKKEVIKEHAREVQKNAKEGVETIMQGFKPRKRGGVGFGPERGLDGIEYFLTQHAFETPRKAIIDSLESKADDLAELGLRSAAIAEILDQFEMGDKSALWHQHAQGLKAPALQLIADAKEKKGAVMLAAVQKIHEACTACHYHFRK